MSKITWHAAGTKKFEAGVSKGVFYPQTAGKYESGAEPWNGLTAVNESPSGAEVTDLWADDVKYGSLRSGENYGGTIEAYTYPDGFEKCDGYAEVAPGAVIGQQARQPFGMSYVSQIGSDAIAVGTTAYKIHLVWGATVSPSERTHNTINESPEADTMSWEYTCDPVTVTGHKPTASMTIDSTKVAAEKLKDLEDVLYGSESTEAKLPLPDEVIALIGAAAAAN